MTDKLLDFEIVDLAELKDDGSNGFRIEAKEAPSGKGCGYFLGGCDGGGCGWFLGLC